MMLSLRLYSLSAIFALVAACGVVSPPPSPPSPPVSQPPTSPPMSQATPPAKEATAPAPTPAPKPVAPAAPSKSAPPAAAAKSPATAATKAPPVATAAATPPIDLKSLELKLKDSKAIGVMTKLSLKNQVDDLVAQFRAFHDGRQPPTLAQLRQPFELLLMKVLSLLQDGDPALAKALHDSRDYIWGLLADRNKFLANL